MTPARQWAYRGGFFFGGATNFAWRAGEFPAGFGTGLAIGGFVGFQVAEHVELRLLVDDFAGVGFNFGRAVPRAALTSGLGFVAWAGFLGFGVSGVAGVSWREYLGVTGAVLGSVRVRFGEQPRHELAVEGGLALGIGLTGGDYYPGFADFVGRFTYTVSWGSWSARTVLRFLLRRERNRLRAQHERRKGCATGTPGRPSPA